MNEEALVDVYLVAIHQKAVVTHYHSEFHSAHVINLSALSRYWVLMTSETEYPHLTHTYISITGYRVAAAAAITHSLIRYNIYITYIWYLLYIRYIWYVMYNICDIHVYYIWYLLYMLYLILLYIIQIVAVKTVETLGVSWIKTCKSSYCVVLMYSCKSSSCVVKSNSLVQYTKNHLYCHN